MINKVILVGRVGKKPEVHQAGETPVCNFSLATNRSWKDKNGQKKESTFWHRIVVWGKQAELCAQYLDKGSMAYVEGMLELREYTDREGVAQRSIEVRSNDVRFLDGRKSEHGGAQQRQPEVYRQAAVQQPAMQVELSGPQYGRPDPNEDIPF